MQPPAPVIRRAVAGCHLLSKGSSCRSALREAHSLDLARRAYRRPVTEKDVERLLGFYEAGRLKADSRPASNEVSNESCGAEFIFRIEEEPVGKRLGRSIASMIWRSRHDCHFSMEQHPGRSTPGRCDPRKAERPGDLARQVRRMFDDPQRTGPGRQLRQQWLSLASWRVSCRMSMRTRIR